MTDNTSEQIYDFICKTIEEDGLPPTLKEITDACHLSKTAVTYHLYSLEGSGRILRIPGKARGIKVTAAHRRREQIL